MFFLQNGSRLSVVRPLHRKYLSAHAQHAVQMLTYGSQVFGSLFGGQVSDFIGRKFTVLIALVFSIVAITLEMVSTTDPMFFGAKFLNGFAVGTIQAVASAYIGEVWSHHGENLRFEAKTAHTDRSLGPQGSHDLSHRPLIHCWPLCCSLDCEFYWQLY